MEQVIQILENSQLDENHPLVVGVSGGADSIALMHLLSKSAHSVIVAHLNHQLRKESGEDAYFVQQVAKGMNLSIVVSSADVKTHAAQHKLSLEEAARNLRYQFLFGVAEKHQAQAVLVAHTADDQVETILMHLLRGAGMDGLRGMDIIQHAHSWHPYIPLIRPLLHIWREEIETYCQANDLAPIEDPSNMDITFFRNRLRHELIPLLKTYNPQIKDLLWRTATTIRGESEVIQSMAEIAWKYSVTTFNSDYVQFDLSKFKIQSIAIQRRLARKALSELNQSLRDIGYDAVKRLLHFVDVPTTSKRLELIANFNALLEENSLFIYQQENLLPTSLWPQYKGMPITISQNTPIQLDQDWQIVIQGIQLDANTWAKIKNNQDQNQAWLNIPAHTHLHLRNPQEGEKFKPMGMKGQKTKLSDFFINEKIPERARKQWPILCTPTEIIWVCGLRIAEPYRINEQSEHTVFIKIGKQ